MKLKPREKTPSLEVWIPTDQPWRLADQTPARFTMVVFYRGLHCPVCKLYLRQLDTLLEPFARRGTDVIAISCDDRARAERAVLDWGLKRLRIGYGLTIEQARGWDLFISNAIKEGEPAQFSEPGLALVKADGTLYAISLQSMPFARPHFDDVLTALDFVIQANYPARGEAE